jgi:hypothetical protein
MNELVVMYTEDDVATMNPEDLLENGQPASMLLAGEPAKQKASKSLQLAARNLAIVLLDSEPLALARLLEEFSESGGHTPAIGNTVVELLEKKIKEASPDEINALVVEAKEHFVWQWVKPAVLARNELLAKAVIAITNPEALDLYLEQVATSTGDSPWLPGPVFDAAVTVVRQLVNKANILQLDRLGDLAWRWRIKPKVSNDLRRRHNALVDSIAKYNCGNGFVMQHGTKSMLVENPNRALRLAHRGYSFVEQEG